MRKNKNLYLLVVLVLVFPIITLADIKFDRTLKSGSTGQDVEQLQSILSLDDTLYPEKIVTGYFGRLTEKAVKILQTKLGFEAVGVVGPKTRAFLNSIVDNPSTLLAAAVKSTGGQTTMGAPTNLVASNITSNSVTLSWTDNSIDETNFQVERSVGNTSNFILYTEVPQNIVSYTNTGLTASTTYYYRVRALKAKVKPSYSGYSNTVMIKTLQAVPTPSPSPIPTPTPTGTPTPTPTPTSTVTYLWGKRYTVASELNASADNRIYSLSLDGSGNVFTNMNYAGAMSYNDGYVVSVNKPDLYMGKIDTNGNTLMYKSIGMVNNGLYNNVVVDSNGDRIITIEFQNIIDLGGTTASTTPPNYANMLIAKYSGSTGNLIWSKVVGGVNGNYGSASGFGMAVDNSGDIYIGGTFLLSTDFGGVIKTATPDPIYNYAYSDVFVAKYSGSNGSLIWVKTFGNTQNDYLNDLAFDKVNNRVLVVGSFPNTINFGGGNLTASDLNSVYHYADIYIASFSAVDGSYVWSKSYGSAGVDNGSAVTVDSQGNVYISGDYGSANFGCGALTSQYGGTDAYVVKLNSTGSCVWSKNIGSSNTDSVAALNTDKSGNLLLVGRVTGSAVNVGNGPVTLSGVSASNMLVARYSLDNGSYVWGKIFEPILGEVTGYTIASDQNNDIYVGGQYVGKINFGGGEWMSFYGQPPGAPLEYLPDAFLIKLK